MSLHTAYVSGSNQWIARRSRYKGHGTAGTSCFHYPIGEYWEDSEAWQRLYGCRRLQPGKCQSIERLTCGVNGARCSRIGRLRGAARERTAGGPDRFRGQGAECELRARDLRECRGAEDEFSRGRGCCGGYQDLTATTCTSPGIPLSSLISMRICKFFRSHSAGKCAPIEAIP